MELKTGLEVWWYGKHGKVGDWHPDIDRFDFVFDNGSHTFLGKEEEEAFSEKPEMKPHTIREVIRYQCDGTYCFKSFDDLETARNHVEKSQTEEL